MDRMKILISVGMVIVFISVFFVLFILSIITERYIECSAEGICSLKPPDFLLVICLIFIGLFVLIDALTLYLILNSIKTEVQ